MALLLFLLCFVECAYSFSSFELLDGTAMAYRVKRDNSSNIVSSNISTTSTATVTNSVPITKKPNKDLTRKVFAIISTTIFLLSLIFLIGVLQGAWCSQIVKVRRGEA
uniref:Col_cuticle_N domain-containing protein n=1 Tax=Meloidogyne hapla TaxID=6305 RepID=A0A1I8BNM8_MELHA